MRRYANVTVVEWLASLCWPSELNMTRLVSIHKVLHTSMNGIVFHLHKPCFLGYVLIWNFCWVGCFELGCVPIMLRADAEVNRPCHLLLSHKLLLRSTQTYSVLIACKMDGDSILQYLKCWIGVLCRLKPFIHLFLNQTSNSHAHINPHSAGCVRFSLSDLQTGTIIDKIDNIII